MRSPIILEGDGFDWQEANKLTPVDDEGNVNWFAAMGADPGVMQCPNCGEYLWNEGRKVQCPECDHIWVRDELGPSDVALRMVRERKPQ